MPQWLSANLLILGLLLVSAVLFLAAYWISGALGLLPEERRYVMAATGVLALIVNAVLAKRFLRALTRITVDKR